MELNKPRKLFREFLNYEPVDKQVNFKVHDEIAENGYKRRHLAYLYWSKMLIG
jgi:hypothetical protein